MSESHVATSDKPELHSFVKLAIAYLGIMSGFVVLGLGFYVIAARDEATGYPVPIDMYYANVGSYALLLVLSLTGLTLLVKRKVVGAYVALATLVLSVAGPPYLMIIQVQVMYSVIWWFAIPNAIVGILLLKSLKTLN